jgi:hypothetical protein
MKKITGIVLLLFAAFIIILYVQRETALFSNGQADKLAGLDNKRVSFHVPNIKVNKKTMIQFALKDEKGAKLRGLNDTEQGKIRVLIVDGDLARYDEIQPSFSGNGLFSFPYTFKKNGQYSLFLYVLEGEKKKMFARKSIQIGEKQEEREPLKVNSMLTTAVDGIEMSVIFNLLEPENKEKITFHFQSKKQDSYTLLPSSGKQPRLLIVDENSSTVLFASPEKSKRKDEVHFMVTFPAPGLYKIWADFYVNGKKYEKEFVVTVADKKKAG